MYSEQLKTLLNTVICILLSIFKLGGKTKTTFKQKSKIPYFLIERIIGTIKNLYNFFMHFAFPYKRGGKTKKETYHE